MWSTHLTYFSSCMTTAICVHDIPWFFFLYIPLQLAHIFAPQQRTHIVGSPVWKVSQKFFATSNSVPHNSRLQRYLNYPVCKPMCLKKPGRQSFTLSYLLHSHKRTASVRCRAPCFAHCPQCQWIHTSLKPPIPRFIHCSRPLLASKCWIICLLWGHVK